MMLHPTVRHTSLSHQLWTSRGSVEAVMKQSSTEILSSSMTWTEHTASGTFRSPNKFQQIYFHVEFKIKLRNMWWDCPTTWNAVHILPIHSSSLLAMIYFLSDCERILCALLCPTGPAQSPEECGVCNWQEWINEWTQDAPGERMWRLLKLLCLFHRVIVWANFPPILQFAIPSLLSTWPHMVHDHKQAGTPLSLEFSVLIGWNDMTSWERWTALRNSSCVWFSTLINTFGPLTL